jgi:hypothetical protein
MYPSSDRILVAALSGQFPSVRVCTELPADLESVLPAIQVTRFGGNDEVLTMEMAITDVDVWATSYAAADVLASQVHTWMRLSLPGRTYTGPSGTGTVARVRTQSGFCPRPSGNPDIKRVGGVLEVWIHSG